MNKKTMERLEHRLCTELDEISEKERLSTGDLDVIEKASHSLKSLAAIKANESGQGYSQAGYPMGSHGRGGNWTAEGSYGRPGMMYGDDRGYSERSRDSMGRYSSAEGPDAMRETLREMIDSGKLDQKQREAANRFMDTMM